MSLHVPERTGRGPGRCPGLDRSVEGYAFFRSRCSAERRERDLFVGGGADWLAGGRIDVALDAHLFGWWDCSSCGAFFLTGNVGFLTRRQSALDRWEPFARVGLGGAGLGIGALSAGTKWWFGEPVGLRFEGRYEYVYDEEGYLHFRAGVVF